MRILIVEDEKKVSAFIQKGLEESNFAVDIAVDGNEGMYQIQNEAYDAVILDLMLPGCSGLDILKEIRGQGNDIPVICLTAKGKHEDKMAGFDAGTDDYLVKPFRFAELLARLRSLLRRSSKRELNQILNYGDLSLDQKLRKASRANTQINLTPKEYAILEYLMLNPEQVITRTMIAESAWDYNFDLMSNVIDVHLRRLREKIDGNSKAKLIHTVRGMGYVLSQTAP